jgi:hypothetical protein
MRSARSTSSNTSGTDRQPSSYTCTPSRATILGLISTCGWSRSALRSITTTRLATPTWVAARPMPLAAYMVCAMSSMN